MTLAILFIAGFLSGAINSVAAGGVLIAFPVMLMSGMNPLTATITSYLLLSLGYVSSLATNSQDIKKLPKKHLILVIPYLIGGSIGVYWLNSTSSETFNAIVPWLLLFTVMLFILQPYLQSHIHRPHHLRPKLSLLIVSLCIFLVAIYAGYFGIGSGLILLTLFGFTRIKNIYLMIGLKNLASLLVALLATFVFAFNGKIDWESGIILGAGGALGGYTGAKFIHHFSPKVLRAIVSLVGLTVVIWAFTKF